MIERKFVAEQLKEFQVQEFISNTLKNVGHSHTKLQRTPLGEKIIVYASRPGLVVGRKGENIKKLTLTLKKKFGLENPQIEISEVGNIFLDAQIVAEIIASTLERFGPQRFKGVGHKMMSDIMNAGALGVEILISGKIPGARAKTWRFYQGYLKKCGDIVHNVSTAYTSAQLKSGTVGIKVKIMPPDIELPDRIKYREEKTETAGEKKEEAKEEKAEEKKEEPKEAKKKAPRKRKAPKKEKSEEKAEE
ncbi:30S ribosomal protein S3 [Candidatus Woesearchaeota archaeon]|nr:30S ribosomal protein S3 [Candidatus Woesearchaeota archaeon]